MKKFEVTCTAEIDNYIGSATAHIVAENVTDWYIDCITNNQGSTVVGEDVSILLYAEIRDEVREYFTKDSK